MLQKRYTGEQLQALLDEAEFHLGRVLYEGKIDFDLAVSYLEAVVGRGSDNAQAFYYLGQAIREQVERNTLKHARDMLGEYLARGAPLGHEDEVREFLGVRTQG